MHNVYHTGFCGIFFDGPFPTEANGTQAVTSHQGLH